MHVPRATKLIFNKDEAWEKYLTHCGDNITTNQIEYIEKMVVTPIDLSMVKFTFYKRSNNLIVHLFAFRKTNGFSY
ncbi:hypothetical protein Q8W15_06445 [Photobacterium damselae subsp. piscicida]|nr:hypothetical protein [Photobacterium damselae]MBE8126674.1 hypothetical protein [Photobacterium damselae subsp. piscicida]MDP2534090.1 hypothetical protein [Photobacterium damselae subsp. piscicida]MDP2557086.1 hypothetical protein [Photobacterium damselae subsp. piscicida]MDP2568166.1 hypothetical protein [Photobacterium damselae subsp. piscicida]QOD54529.1 hypothetical protein IC628_21550 [Photobacterium damselae subsp. piscicida]